MIELALYFSMLISINLIFQTKLFPAIHLHWLSYQSELCAKIKDAKQIVLSGDGRHDSMGHSAKYCAYSFFCHEPFNAIFDFSLVQVSNTCHYTN